MHPNLLDAEIGALAHGGQCVLRPGSYHHGLHTAGDGLQIMKAPVAFHLVGVGVDGEHLVPKLTPVTATRFLARNSRAASWMVNLAVISARARPFSRAISSVFPGFPDCVFGTLAQGCAIFLHSRRGLGVDAHAA
jgi:hypothetical protein